MKRGWIATSVVCVALAVAAAGEAKGPCSVRDSVAGKVIERGAQGRLTGGVSIECKKSGRFTPMCKNWRAAPRK